MFDPSKKIFGYLIFVNMEQTQNLQENGKAPAEPTSLLLDLQNQPSPPSNNTIQLTERESKPDKKEMTHDPVLLSQSTSDPLLSPPKSEPTHTEDVVIQPPTKQPLESSQILITDDTNGAPSPSSNNFNPIQSSSKDNLFEHLIVVGVTAFPSKVDLPKENELKSPAKNTFTNTSQPKQYLKGGNAYEPVVLFQYPHNP